MNEQELRTSITPCIMAGNTWFVFDEIKAYADAETKELEEAYAELKSSYEKFYESDAVQHKQILALNAEIKRLRDALLWLKENRTPDRAMIEVFIDKTLSPAPVTDVDHDNVLPTDDEIHFVAVDESNADRHGWISLNQKPAYVDGFEDGAKWMRNKKTT